MRDLPELRVFHLRLTEPTLIKYPFPVDIGLTVRSGQLLSWEEVDSESFRTPSDRQYLMFHRGSLLRMKNVAASTLEVAVDGAPLTEEEIETIMGVTNQPDILTNPPAGGDPFLGSLFRFYRGLILLKQDPYECLISFMTSGMSTMSRTRKNLAVLRKQWGSPIGDTGYHALPSATSIASLPDPEKELRKMGFGYRAKAITQTCKILARDGWYLAQWGELKDAALRERLTALPGVGQKIAECVMLFGFGRMSAFPVDVWVTRALESRWPSGSIRSPDQWNRWAKEKWGLKAGIIQQMLFVWARDNPKGDGRRGE